MNWKLKTFLMLTLVVGFAAIGFAQSEVPVFSNHSDVGDPQQAGSFEMDGESYKVSGGGANMWDEHDSFHFVWKVIEGDFTLESAIDFVDSEGHEHKKAGLMVRDNLNPSAAHAHAVVHADGLTSLQFRELQGEITEERVAETDETPARIRLDRRGEICTMFVGDRLGNWQSVGSARVALEGPVYVGMAVCSHDDLTTETAIFSDVNFKQDNLDELVLQSRLETFSFENGRNVVFADQRLFEAPNWAPDNTHFIVNSEGKLYRVSRGGAVMHQIPTGLAKDINNDHGISPDGSQLVISNSANIYSNRTSRIYTLPFMGGNPQLVTIKGPSYWHGWSPDGNTLVYCAERNGNYDVYSIPVTGGEESRLTTAEGLDDGPEYSPDGQWIYFNSDRTGTMQIWRMRPNGSDQEQVTTDDMNDWFAHPSPDGNWLVFVSFKPEVEGHPRNQNVLIRRMPIDGGEVETLTTLFGGQGTMNVPSWSPDGRAFAFVSYQYGLE